MRRNVIVLGEQELSGEIGRVLAAGEVHVGEGSVRSVWCAGEVGLSKCRVEKLRTAGEVIADAVEFGNVKIVGALNTKGICRAERVAVEGMLTAEHLECRWLRYGRLERRRFVKKPGWTYGLKGYMKGETLEIASELDLELSDGIEFQTIFVASSVLAPAGIACERFYATGTVRAPSISADVVVMKSDAESDVEEISGSEIRIVERAETDARVRGFAKRVGAGERGAGGIMKVGEINGDRVELDHVRAKRVCGRDVTIGPLCVVDRVEAQGSLDISEKAIVGEVVRG